jgi:hypothetical protein
MKVVALLVLLFLAGCSAQAFVRVWFLAYGEPTTYSYFDYDPAKNALLRIQTIDDQKFLNGLKQSLLVSFSFIFLTCTGSIAADDTMAFGILYLYANPSLITNLITIDQLTCQLTLINLPFASGFGLTVDPNNKWIYFNYQSLQNGISGIDRMKYDGNNLTSIYNYPTVNSSHWLSV